MTRKNDKQADAPAITIKGARVNNLKGVDVSIPRGCLVVITGVSGSGKSSLAFDTLYAEGRRRYVESLSAYARQFMGRLSKPEVDYIRGLPPAIAIEQNVNTRNPRSTVGTSTEIYDYLRLLFSRIGVTVSPVSGEIVKKHTIEDVVNLATSFPERTRLILSSPIVMPERRRFSTQLQVYLQGGYTRLVQGGEFIDIATLLEKGEAAVDALDSNEYRLMVDRLAVSSNPDELSRLREGIENAFFEGRDAMVLTIFPQGEEPQDHHFSRRFEADGITFLEPTDQLFNFNNPYGACPKCEGYGNVLGIDPRLVVPDTSRSIYDDAVMPWRGEKMSEYKRALIRVAAQNNFPIHAPYSALSAEQLQFLWHGNASFPGIDGFFKMLESSQHKIQYRVMLAHYRGKTPCPVCHGSRLRREASYIHVGGATISQLADMPVEKLLKWFEELQLTPAEQTIAKRLLVEIKSRLRYLVDVGLGYLTLSRRSNTLSGGESQRISLATQLGSSLVGSLYILDEPSIGLHPVDTRRLISVLQRLRDLGNTVLVVEHDEEIMRSADHLIDVGPDAGALGGEIIYQGPPDKIGESQGHTADYLSGRLSVPVPAVRRRPIGHITVEGASEHNLKNIDATFPLGVMTVVTGVSGSGKSTLVRDILFRTLTRRLGGSADTPGAHRGLSGDIGRITAVEMVDQSPVGKSSRSNPATYLKAYDEIRRLYADTQLARQTGLTPAHFSFNTDGGRCEECKGEGSITIEMQFMADITIPCPSCHGQRFKPEVLAVQYRGHTISDLLNLTVDQAVELFSQGDTPTERAIVRRLEPLQRVGLGYVKIGQSSSTLSGGENQRLKLAAFLANDRGANPTMFIFDEPTTGLHPADIATLLRSINTLVDHGHTAVIIEHSIDVIRAADHIIDIGPHGGDRGGEIVAVGTPEEVAQSPDSATAEVLREALSRNSKS